jgi:CxxC motif-containing protein (DUF1111 family)
MVWLLGLGCGDDVSGPPAVDPGIYSRLGEPRRNASPAERAQFERGRAVAERRFSPPDGLGAPGFNVTFCGACHEKPVFGGSAGRYRNFNLVARVDGERYTPLPLNGVQRTYGPDGFIRTSSAANHFATRNPIPFFGTGLINEIDPAEILSNEDPDDADGDGISGRANDIGLTVGRFGRKAQTDSIEGFIRGPLFNHLGLTTAPLTAAQRAALPSQQPPLDFDRLTAKQAVLPDELVRDGDDVPDPELDGASLFDLVAWTLLLGAPEPDPPTDATERGRDHFAAAGCTGCHLPQLRGPRGPVPLYSDLLLHDMGPELADGVRMGAATGSEFRTQPLWGIVAVGPYLHDGRADTLDAAIRWHGGEAAASRDAYQRLPAEARDELIAFLESLGGRDQRSEGLIPPGSPLGDVGSLGGPDRPLDPAETDRFLRGRAAFDRDVFTSAGVGPKFNGDSCRACHFEPDVGGAGPLGVNVVRQGGRDGDRFIAPEEGTVLHRFLVAPDQRQDADPVSTFFELRQTPSLFGLGRLEQVPEARILERVDPRDVDEDGVSGRVHRLSDGRLGRFGWRADIPSLAEFMRDAMSVELGLTLPEQPGLTFGTVEDEDDIPDPEVTSDVLDDLRFWTERLAPPAPVGGAEAGRSVFMDIACADCHRADLLDGGPQPYTDLLLHDVAPPGAFGVPAGDASGREFRTPPLWGIRDTAPYLHDGSATTLEEAVLAHDGEAAASRDAFLARPASEREALLDFLRSL